MLFAVAVVRYHCFDCSPNRWAYLGAPLGIHELLGKVKESEYVTGVTSAFINHIRQNND